MNGLYSRYTQNYLGINFSRRLKSHDQASKQKANKSISIKSIPAQMSEFKDTNIIMHELEQLFNRDDDIRDVLDIKKMKHEIEVQCAAHLKDTKEVIKGSRHKA